MEVVEVRLPEGDWIEAHAVARAVAQALFPQPPTVAQPPVARLRGEFRPPMGPSVEQQLRNVLWHCGELSHPLQLQLLSVHAGLPRSAKPDWLPRTPGEAKTWADYMEAYEGNFINLADLVAQGSMRAMDSKSRVSRLLLRLADLLSRQQVIEYLERRNFAIARSAPAKGKPWSEARRREAADLVQAYGGNMTRAAKHLGMSRQNLSRELGKDSPTGSAVKPKNSPWSSPPPKKRKK